MQSGKGTEHGIGWEARRVGHCDAAIQMQRVRCAAEKVSADKSDTWTYTIVFAGTENNTMNMYGSAGDGRALIARVFCGKSLGPSADGPFCFGKFHRNFRRANDPVKSMGRPQIFDHKRRKEK